MLTEATGDAELVLWDGREFGHWLSATENCCRMADLPKGKKSEQ